MKMTPSLHVHHRCNVLTMESALCLITKQVHTPQKRIVSSFIMATNVPANFTSGRFTTSVSFTNHHSSSEGAVSSDDDGPDTESDAVVCFCLRGVQKLTHTPFYKRGKGEVVSST